MIKFRRSIARKRYQVPFRGMSVLPLILSLFIASCGTNDSAWMKEPDNRPPELDDTTDPIGSSAIPQAEILFVIDNSASMDKHIRNVSANIDRFVKAFTYQNPLEFRFAVMPVHDRRTYTSTAYIEKFGKNESLGTFLPVKSSTDNVVADKYFIDSSDKNLGDLLSHTLKIGTRALDQGGPEMEELFSPIAAVYGLMKKDVAKEALQTQKGFFFGEHSYKIIFFVTDAGDSSNWSPSDLYYNLVALSGGDKSKVMAFGAIIPKDDNRCTRDPGQSTKTLEEFLSLTRRGSEGTNVASLCDADGKDSFGQKFAKFGESIRARTVSQRIQLKRLPVISNNRFSCPQDQGGDPTQDETLRVFYGANPDPCLNQEIFLETSDEIIGFRYDPRDNSIVLNPKLELEPIPGAKFHWKFTAIDPLDWQYGRVKRTRF